MASITRVIPYIVDEQTHSVLYCQAVSERLELSLQRCDPSPLLCAIRTLAQWLNLISLTIREWELGVHGEHPGYLCFSKYVCIYSFTHEEKALFVPLPGQKATALECEVQVDASFLIALYNIAKRSSLLQGVRSNQTSPLLSLPRTVLSPQYLLFNLNTQVIGQFESLYIGLFRMAGEVWNSYIIPQGQYPDDSVLRGVKGIVLTGGKDSVNDGTGSWMSDFLDWMNRLYETYPSIRIVGICLGAQVMAKALGGSVRRRKGNGYIIGIDDVYMTSEFIREFPEGRRMYGIPSVHSEEIFILPSEGVLYGSSSNCDIEVWGIPSHLLATQGHPNCVRNLMSDVNIPRYRRQNLIDDKTQTELLRTLHLHQNDSEHMIALMNKFLRS